MTQTAEGGAVPSIRRQVHESGALGYVLDYEQTRFRGGAAGGADRPTEKSVQTRLQLSF
jgi:hypothetical protein